MSSRQQFYRDLADSYRRMTIGVLLVFPSIIPVCLWISGDAFTAATPEGRASIVAEVVATVAALCFARDTEAMRRKHLDTADGEGAAHG